MVEFLNTHKNMKNDKQYPIKILPKSDFPPLLKHINDPPQTLYIRGVLSNDPETKYLCVVGSRAYTSYGEEVCKTLISGLRGQNIIIVSGLALGIDSIAHRSALDAKLTTFAVPGSGLNSNVLYPRANWHLAEKILDSGGAIISEEEPSYRATPYSFPKRNRIMAGMSHAVLVIEAELKSGTLITSKYATEYNRDVFTVPGSIFSKKSDGPHMLLRLGATPVRKSDDILEALGFSVEDENKKEKTPEQIQALYQKTLALCTPDERATLSILADTSHTRDELIRLLTKSLGKTVSEITALLMMMEIKDLVVEKMGEIFIV